MRRTSASSLTLPSTKRTPSGTFSRKPPERPSRPTTSMPSCWQAAATWRPMKPAAPVTSARAPLFRWLTCPSPLRVRAQSIAGPGARDGEAQPRRASEAAKARLLCCRYEGCRAGSAGRHAKRNGGPGLEPAAGTVSEPRFERRTDAAGMAALLRVFIVPVFGFLTFFVALAIGVPWDRVGLLGLATLTGTLLITVVSVDRTRPRERRNLLFSLVTFSYFVFFVLPVYVF